MSQTARRRQVPERPPPPGPGPQSLTCGARAPRAPPASGTAAAGREREAENFLLPARNPEVTPKLPYRRGRLPRVAPSPLPRFAERRTHDVRCSRSLSRDLESGVLAPPGVQFFLLRALRLH